MSFFPETECHRLIREKKWDALVARLKTPEGIADAKRTLKVEDIPNNDPDWNSTNLLLPTLYPHSIYHCPNTIFEAPISVIRAMTEANPNGWTTRCVIGANSDGNPIEEQPIFRAFRHSVSNPIEEYPIDCDDSRDDVRDLPKENLLCILQDNPNVARQHYPGMPSFFPLHAACNTMNDDAVKLLLDAYPEAISHGGNTMHGLPIFIGIENELKSETLRHLFAAYPAAAKLKASHCEYFSLLHHAVQFSIEIPILESIVYSNLSACSAQDEYGNLPIHNLLHPILVFNDNSLEKAFLLLRVYPDSVKVPDDKGNLPLHLLCDAVFENEREILTLEKLLKLYPAGALVKNNSGYLPIELFQKIFGHRSNVCKNDAFIELLRAAPQSLLARSNDYDDIIFCEFYRKTDCASENVWKNVAIHCPRALCSMDDEGITALSFHFSNERLAWAETNTPSSEELVILNTTVQCLRHGFSCWSNTPVSDVMSWTHKVIYCGYLYPSPSTLPLPFCKRDDDDDKEEDDSQSIAFLRGDDSRRTSFANEVMSELDSEGNNAFHIACSAPCSTEEKKCTHRDMSLVSALVKWMPKDVVRGGVAHRNTREETPLLVLLKNKNACRASFVQDVQTLSSFGNVDVISVLDPPTKLFPFMSAAVFGKERDAILSISSTYHLLQRFVSRHSLESFCHKDRA